VCPGDQGDAGYGISILGVSEMRWSSCGKLMMATREAVLYSGMDEGENDERGVGLILSGDAAKSLQNGNQCLRGLSGPGSTLGGSRSPSYNVLPQQMKQQRKRRMTSMNTCRQLWSRCHVGM